MSILVSGDIKFTTLADAKAYAARLGANARMAKIKRVGTWGGYVANVDVVLTDAQFRSLFPDVTGTYITPNSARNYRFNNTTLKSRAVKFAGGNITATNPDNSVVS